MSKHDIIISKANEDVANVAKITLVSKKAQKAIGEQFPEKKKEFNIVKEDVYKIVSLAVSHGLSVDSKLPIIIPARPCLNQDEIQKAIGSNMPKSFLPKKLFAIGKSKFKGGDFESVNEQFEKGQEYPVYEEEGMFVVGKNGKGYKMTPACWSKIISY